MRTKSLLLLALPLALGLLVGRFVLGGGEETQSLGSLSDTERLAHAASHILFRTRGSERSPAQARKLAQLAYRDLEAGAAFEDVATGRSEGASATDGGFLGFIDASHDTSFAGAVQALRPGQVSPPIRTGIGWQIVKRHTFAEARELEKKFWIPTHGFFVPWGEMQNSQGRTKEQAHAMATGMLKQLAAGRLTLEQAQERVRPGQPANPEAFVGMTANRPNSRAAYEALIDEGPGRMIGPIETENGWGVLVRGRHLRSLVAHILIQHHESKRMAEHVRRTRGPAAALTKQVLAKVLADPSTWDSLVERYSDDTQSREKGGLMGILGPGLMPPGFEAVLYDLPPGEICKQVIETPYGFHIVWKLN